MTLNLNNLEDRKAEMEMLQASEATIAAMEKMMREGGGNGFTLDEFHPAKRGQVDVVYYFQKGKHSDNFYLNRYTVAHNIGKQLEEGQKYMVFNPKDGKIIKQLDNITEAIKLFQERGPKVELAVGKDGNNKVTIASMEEGKVNYVNRDYRSTYYGKFVSQTIWPERGKGFTVPQSAQMIQGHSVFRGDLVNFKTGQPYEAWVKLDMDKGVGRSGNFDLQQFSSQYGFELGKVLDLYNIKELQDPEKRKDIESKIENGFTPFVTVEKDGQDLKLSIEASPRYRTINFFDEGKMEKREQFLVEIAPEQNRVAEIFSKKDQAKETEKSEEMGIGR
ncbi:MAG: hypothetical protein P0Y49_04720 [Candidatus Pedobacter colombiensis]|uniref:DUF3945 domain-containing protein n=1 Tax=Candidatus Pedobacter colombiensis TaxID=3121371 RepID=A0AAJ5WB95_9SPHI|nr:hypothetical protein [Pedobacter sp.]WEK20440.1 MAG: hypothetical protein P0Y49_04720 [Pedobacter sp.]